jgi:ribonuclease J
MPDDTVIVSATPIPGNEETVARTIDNLMRLGADVIYEPLADVHVSGHGSREELKLMLNLIKPKYCVPVHGEYRHLVLYRRLATEVGIDAENVVLAEIGDVIEFDEERVAKVDHHSVGSVLVDGVTIGGSNEVVLRDRLHLSRDGVLIVAITLDRTTGAVIAGPEVISRGIVEPGPYADGSLIEQARDRVREALLGYPSTSVEYGFVVSKIKETVGEFIYQRIRARPMILSVVTEV